MILRNALPLLFAFSTLAASAQQPGSITIADQRPKMEAERRGVMGWMTRSDGYGMSRNGDRAMAQSPVDLLKQRVAESTTGATTVTVYHLVSYSNSQAALRNILHKGLLFAALDKSIGGDYPVSTSLVDRSKFESYVDDDEWRRAVYGDEENPKMTSVLITFLDAELDGKRVIVRAMTPGKFEDDRNPSVESVETAIRFWLTQVRGAPAPAPAAAASGVVADTAAAASAPAQ